MLRSTSRILTTHTGSLPRPDELRALYVRRQAGEDIDPGELDGATRRAIRLAVDRQAAAGIDVGNDGEQGRENFFLHITRRLAGFGGEGWDRPLWADVEHYPGYQRLRAEERRGRASVTAREKVPEAIAEVTHISGEAADRECEALAATLEAAGRPFAETFVTAPSPGILARAFRNRYYDTERDYVAALGRALRNEYETIVAHGFLLQIDAPDLALERHAGFKDRPLADFLDFAGAVVDAINAALADIPPQKVRMHVCWGNYEGPHDCDIDLETLLPVVTRAGVGALVLPFANGRHAVDFKALEAHPLPGDQLLVAGVVDTLTNVIEHPEVIADRLQRIAAAVGDPSKLLAGTDCGFDTAAGSGRVADDVVWAKLASLAEGARRASARLF